MARAGAADGRRSLTILVFAAVGFAALVISGLGIVSLLLDTAVIVERGMTQLPGITGTVFAILGFAAVAYPALLRRAGIGMALLAGIAAAVAYVIGVAVGALFSGADPPRAGRVAGGIAGSSPASVILGSGLLSGGLSPAAVGPGPDLASLPTSRAPARKRRASHEGLGFATSTSRRGVLGRRSIPVLPLITWTGLLRRR